MLCCRFPWLHYVVDGDKVLCFTCKKAHDEKKLLAHNAEPSFIQKGYTNWKDATNNFRKHEQSKCHADAVLKTVTAPKTMPDVGEMLWSQHAKEKAECRQCLLKIIGNVKFLARQGLALRGDGKEEGSNFTQLLELRAIDNPVLSHWVQRSTDKYTSPQVQNEMLKVMGLAVLSDIGDALRSTQFLTIMVDETTDAANQEQVVLCLRWGG